MSYEYNEEFSVELTDADLEEINGGALKILKGFPLGTINPELLNPKQFEIQPELVFPNGMFPPFETLGNIRQF